VAKVVECLLNKHEALSSKKKGLKERENRALFSHKKEQNHGIFRKMDATWDHVKQNKPDSEMYVSHVFSHMQNVENDVSRRRLLKKRKSMVG
jgi:hypothetical protein